MISEYNEVTSFRWGGGGIAIRQVKNMKMNKYSEISTLISKFHKVHTHTHNIYIYIYIYIYHNRGQNYWHPWEICSKKALKINLHY